MPRGAQTPVPRPESAVATTLRGGAFRNFLVSDLPSTRLVAYRAHVVEARPDEQSRSRDGGPPAARGRGGPRPHGDRRRVQIIDTAIDLFSAKGFHAVSLREIADKVGISQMHVSRLIRKALEAMRSETAA